MQKVIGFYNIVVCNETSKFSEKYALNTSTCICRVATPIYNLHPVGVKKKQQKLWTCHLAHSLYNFNNLILHAVYKILFYSLPG